MSSSTREKVMRHINAVGQLQPALHQPQHAPYPDAIDHTLYRAYTRGVHDVGGEPDVPIRWEERKKSSGSSIPLRPANVWRGAASGTPRSAAAGKMSMSVRRCISGMPYYGRWLLTAALIMVDKQYVTLTELVSKIDEVKKRHEHKSPR